MNKKQRFVLGISIVAVLLGYMTFTGGVMSSQYEVGEALAQKDTLAGKIILINGSMVGGSDTWYPDNRTLTFKLTDGTATIYVIYTGEKPDIPPEDEANIQAVVTGQFDDDTFKAYKMLTKCPSKYEASSQDIVKTGKTSY